MKLQRAGLVFFVLPLALVPGCLRDFNQFDASGVDGPNGSAGDSGDGDGDGTGGAGDGDGDGTGGAGDGDGDATGGGAGGPGDGCETNEKLCGEDCIPNNDPATGCDEASCSACSTPANAASACDMGACAVGQCESGFVDCDGEVGTGCEHSSGSFTATACGGCDADCTSIGLNGCSGGLCRCSGASDCNQDNVNAAAVACTASDLCMCGVEECGAGETCIKAPGNTGKCSCGGGEACTGGRVCCPNGSGGATCQRIDFDDASNCGACGWTCGAGQSCVNGVCE